MNTSQFSKRRRGGFIGLTSVVVLLMSYLIISSGCATIPGNTRNTATPTAMTGQAAPTTTPTTAQSTVSAQSTPIVAGQPVMLQDIHMVDAAKGWAITHDKQHVLYTTSGGSQWRDVTPRTGWPQYMLGAAEFLDATYAWVTVQAGADKFSIFHTYNGGQLWLETPLLDQGVGVAQITFIDQQNGWLLLDKGSATSHEAVDIFRTTDGGTTWLKVSSTDQNTGSQSGTLPFAGDKSGIRFISTTTGWVTGTEPVDNRAWLYVTHDGGSTWQPQNLTLPANSNVQVATMPPIFFSSKDGVMPVNLFDGGTKLSIYTTHDGGTSWKGSTPALVPSSAVAFVDANHGWAVGGNNVLAVYGTSDGGQHWTALTPSVGSGVEGVSRLDFVSATNGWLLGTTASNSTLLYQTSDGGKTWKQVIPSAIQ